MAKLCVLALFLIFCVHRGLSQDTTILLFGPSFGTNKSWRTYDISPTTNQMKSKVGLEAGLDVFYKAKGKFGLSGDLTFLKTESTVTSYEFFQEVEVNETSKWLTAGTNILFFPLPNSGMLPFLGTGIQLAYLNSSDASLKFTIYPDQEFNLKTELDGLRTDWNYFFRVVGGITVRKIKKHRVIILVTYSKMLGPFSEENSFYSPPYLIYDYSINSVTLKLTVTL